MENMEVSYSNSNRNSQGLESRSTASGAGSMNPNVVLDSAHGCMGSGFAFEAEFLWWRSHMDNLDYAIVLDVPPGVSPTIGSGQFHQPDFKYDPGVRVSAGYDFGSCNWDIFFRWTYHYTDPTSSKTINPATELLLPIRDFFAPAGIIVITFADSGRSEWQNRINVFDFEMGYDYFFSRRFSFRPNFGVKAAWIDMHNRITYTNTLAVDPNQGQPFTLGDVRIRNKSDYWGVGPRVGIDGNLHIGWGFSLYASTSAALLYGQYDTHFRQTDTIPGDDLRFKETNYFRQRAMAQIIVGAEWVKCFSQNYMLSIHVGWEGQQWWNQLEFRYLNDDIKPSGDLTFTGLDVGARFDF